MSDEQEIECEHKWQTINAQVQDTGMNDGSYMQIAWCTKCREIQLNVGGETTGPYYATSQYCESVTLRKGSPPSKN